MMAHTAAPPVATMVRELIADSMDAPHIILSSMPPAIQEVVRRVGFVSQRLAIHLALSRQDATDARVADVASFLTKQSRCLLLITIEGPKRDAQFIMVAAATQLHSCLRTIMGSGGTVFGYC